MRKTACLCLPTIYRSKDSCGKSDCRAIVTGTNVRNISGIVTIPPSNTNIFLSRIILFNISIRLISRLNISYKTSYFPKFRFYLYKCSSNYYIERSFNVSTTKINGQKSNDNRLDNDDDNNSDVIDGNIL